MADKFEKFTERARKVLTLAQEEAQHFNHNYIGTEHILLGLIREGDGVAARILKKQGVELAEARKAVEMVIGRGDSTITRENGLTPRAKHAIELSVAEARRLNHHYIGTEHLLLGLVREGEGIAATALESLGVNLEKVRQQVMLVVSQGNGGDDPSAPRDGAPSQLPLGDLLQVIPVAQTQLRDNAVVTVLSLESYAHGLIIHTRAMYLARQPLAATGAPGPSQLLALDVEDDRGNHYAGGLLTAGNDGRAWYFSYRYGPALDVHARELNVRVTASGATAEGRADAEAREEVHAGPPTFTISLSPEGRAGTHRVQRG
jgi:hypothetical protein